MGPLHGMGWMKIAITWGGIGLSLLQLQLFQFSNSNGKCPPILWSLLANVDHSLHPPTNVQCSLLLPFPDGKCCIFTPKGATESIATPSRERYLPSNSKYLQKQAFQKRVGLKPCMYSVRQVPYSWNNVKHCTGLSVLHRIIQSDDCLLFDLTQQQRLLWISIEFSNANTPKQSASIILLLKLARQVQVYTFHLEYIPFRIRRASASLYISFRTNHASLYNFCRIGCKQVYTLPQNGPTLSGDLLSAVCYYFTMLQLYYAITFLCYSLVQSMQLHT